MRNVYAMGLKRLRVDLLRYLPLGLTWLGFGIAFFAVIAVLAYLT